MSKSLSALWFKSVKRMGRAQQAQGKKMLLSLLPKAVAKAKPASKAAPRAGKASTPADKRRAPRSPLLQLVEAVTPALVKPPRAARAAKVKPVPVTPLAARRLAPVKRAGLPGSWKSFTFSQAATAGAPAGRMAYWLYLPASFDAALPLGDAPAPSRPLVVMLHGCEQSATDFATSTRMNALADSKGFAVLYPQQSAAGDAHRCWHWYKRPTQEGQGDVQLIAAMIAQVQARHGLDTTRTYVAGLSAGAGLANILALRHPELVAAVGLHSGPVFGTTDSPMNAYGVMQHGSAMAHSDAAQGIVKARPDFPGMPVMVVHGGGDTIVRAINAQQLAGQFAIVNAAVLGGAPPVVREFAARGGRTPRHGFRTTTWHAGRKPLIVKVDIDGLGHAWSGGDASVSYSDPTGPDITALMWSFFARHQRVAPRPATRAANLPDMPDLPDLAEVA